MSDRNQAGPRDAGNEIFETVPVPRAYISLAMPVVMGMVVTLVYNLVDTFFVAQTGNLDLVAGVSLASPVLTLMIAMGDMFGLGGSSVISRYFGQHKDEIGRRISVFCYYGALLWGIVVAALLLIFRTPILYLMGADETTFLYTSQYYTIIALGAPFLILTFVPRNQLRSEGNSVASMIGSILGTVVNIILDPILILGLNMGAAGAAIGTVIGYICNDIYYTVFIIRKSPKISVSLKGFHIAPREITPIFAIGLPSSITNLVASFATMITNLFLLPYGTDCVAAMGIAAKVNMIVLMILIGLAFGGQALMGYNYGSGDRKRLRKILRFAYLCECGLALVLSIFLAIAAPLLIRCFLTDPDVIAYGTLMLRMMQPGMLFTGIVLVSTCMFQSAGKALQALSLSAGRQGVIFFLVMVVASRLAGYYGVIAAQAISDILTAGLAVVLMWVTFYRKKGVPA